MDVIIFMGIGILIGLFFFPKNSKIGVKIIKIIQTGSTLVLIFSMGALLGKKDNFLNDLANLGFQSFIMFLIPTLFSIILVYILTQKFVYKKKKNKEEDK